MSDIVEYVRRGAAQITPSIIENAVRQLPMWRMEFTQIHAPKYPHLVDQLDFLAKVVEDFAEGVYRDLPYIAAAEAMFAIMYAHKQTDIIPDSVPDLGFADDSSIVRAVLIQHEHHLSRYAQQQGISWKKITSKP